MLRSLLFSSVKFFSFVCLSKWFIVIDMFGNKKPFSYRRQLYLLTIYFGIVHSALKLIINGRIYWVTFFIKFFLIFSCWPQIFQLCLIKTPSFLKNLFFLRINSVRSSFFQICIEFLSVFHKWGKLHFVLFCFNCWLSDFWHEWFLGNTKGFHPGIYWLQFFCIVKFRDFFETLRLMCSNAKQSQIQFIDFVDEKFLCNVKFSYCFRFKLNSDLSFL